MNWMNENWIQNYEYRNKNKPISGGGICHCGVGIVGKGIAMMWMGFGIVIAFTTFIGIMAN